MQKAVKKQTKKKTVKGSGDYAPELVSLKDPMKRLEGKIDHLEKSLVKNPLSKANAASTIGRTLGNFMGQGDLGALAGSSLAKYFGHGDYKVKSNSLMQGNSAGAKFSGDGKRGTRITEREYIGDVISGSLTGAATDFSNATYIINPSNAKAFPWLSKIAPLYDQWEPNGIIFEFVSTSSEFNGTSQALGTVIMATDYDPYDPSYLNKQEMENSDYSCSTKPALGLIHGIECDPRERPQDLLYTSTNNGAPALATNLGKFQLATIGCSVAGVTLGELWISYDITFYKKQLSNVGLIDVPYLSGNGTHAATVGFWSGVSVTSSKEFTVTQNVGVGSVLNFNNTVGGGTFLVSHYEPVFNTTNDLTNWTASNASVVIYRSTSYPTGSQQVIYLIQSTGANSSFTTSITGASAEYHLYATQVSPGASI